MTLETLEPAFVTVSRGVSLAYVREGRGYPLVFIHGAMGDWRSAAPQWQVFSSRFDCISYSRRYSHPNPNPMNSTNHSALVDAEDLEGLMNALGVERAILVGSSYGGFTALAMAVRAPSRVQAVVAVEPPMMRYALQSEPGASVARAFLESTARPAREAFERGDDATGVALLTGGIVGKSAADLPPAVLARRMQNANAARGLALSDDEFPMLDAMALATLPMPVLLVSGQNTAPVHDAIFGAVTKAMPQARAVKVDGAGHSVSQQAPDRFNALVLDFLHGTLATPA